MTSTEERLSRLEARMEAAEQVIDFAKVKLAELATSGTGRKVLSMLGVKL